MYGGAGTAIAVTNSSMLSGNKAFTQGGAVYCDRCQSFAINQSTIVSWNEAQQSGGGCYFDMGLLVSVEECFVSNNWAGVDGASLWSNNTVSKNTTLALYGYGTSIASLPASIVLDVAPMTNYVSNGNVKLPLTIYVLDQGGLNVTSGTLRASVSLATAGNNSSSGNGSDPLLYGQTEAYADPFGVITITDMMLSAVPGAYTLMVSLPDYPTTQVPPESRPLTVRVCTLGEVQPSNDTCMTCPVTTYSFTPTASKCIAPCPANANCSGGATVVPALGYWHSAPNSTYMAACPNGGACQGDRSALLACQNASYMPLMTSGQLQSMPNNCSLESAVDSTDQLSYMRQQCSPDYYGPLENSEAWESDSHNTGGAELIRVVTVWLQYMSILGNVNIPAPAVPVINLFLLSAWQLLWWSRSQLRRAQTAFVTNPVQSAPAASVHSAAPSQSASAELRQRLLVTLLAVLFYYYPSLLTNAWSLFACYKVDRLSGVTYPQNSRAAWAQGYWVSDMTLPCFTGLHLKWSMALGVPLLFLVCLVIPLLPALLLMQHRTHLDSPFTRLRLGFIYHPYKPSFWYWETIVLVQTLAFVASQVLAISLDSYFQLAIMLMVLLVGFAVLAHLQPFDSSLAQNKQVLGAFTILATAVGCLYFIDVNNVASDAGQDAAGILVLIVNAWFVLWLTALITKASIADVKQRAIWLWQTTKGFSRQGSRVYNRLSSSLSRARSSDGSTNGKSSALIGRFLSLVQTCFGGRSDSAAVSQDGNLFA
ncbi:hypothetical protein WJX79_003206 [Trebouxia sp. C0005]